MKDNIIKTFEESIAVKREFIGQQADIVADVSRLIVQTFDNGGKLLLFGNGGSATDASHIAAEFVGRFKLERPGLPAIALNTDMAVLSCISNDYDYAEVFARQINAIGAEGDTVLAFSTSGNSLNVIRAVEAARARKMNVIAFTGATGGKLASLADLSFRVPSEVTARIQETHITIGHVLCQLVEEILFDPSKK